MINMALMLLYYSVFIVIIGTHSVTKEYIEELKQISTFEVMGHEEHPFKDWSFNDLKNLLGNKDGDVIKQLEFLDYPSTSDYIWINLPDEFDSRLNWPDCNQGIRSQNNCSSCYAHVAAAVSSARLCIATGGRIKITLSPQDIISCNNSTSGCSGGLPSMTWKYIKDIGIVSEECLPYKSGQGDVGMCPFKGNQAQNGIFHKYKVKSYKHIPSARDAKAEIYKHGPISASFRVYMDLFIYKKGVYKKSKNAKPLEFHGVVVLGWGEDDEGEYWICQNSWGVKWGDNGYFKIAFGECGIEESFWTGYPDVLY
jgi:cathepsin B